MVLGAGPECPRNWRLPVGGSAGGNLRKLDKILTAGAIADLEVLPPWVLFPIRLRKVIHDVK
jgi:hypothetical protein